MTMQYGTDLDLYSLAVINNDVGVQHAILDKYNIPYSVPYTAVYEAFIAMMQGKDMYRAMYDYIDALREEGDEYDMQGME